MGNKKYKRKPVKQIVVDAASDASVKVKDNENEATGNKPINDDGKGQKGKGAKGSNKSKARNHHGRRSKKDNIMTVKKAEELAKEGKFVYVDIKINLILAIILSTLLNKTMTAVDALMQKKKVPAFYRRRLRDLVLDEVTGLPKEPKTALIKPLILPTLPLDKIITVNVKVMDLDEADKAALIADLESKHNINEAARLAAHNAQEAQRQAVHNAEEAERKRMHFQQVGEEFEAYQIANANAARETRGKPTQFTPTVFAPGPVFVPIAFVPTVFTAPEIKSNSFEIVNANGQYYKVPVPQVQEVRMPLGQAIQGIESKIFSSLEADEIFKYHSKEMSDYNRMVKNQETDEDNYLNTLWNSLTEESKVAMAAKLPGGKIALETMYTAKQHGPILDLIYATHSNDNLYRNCSTQDKQAFIATEQHYLSADKMKQRPGESVISYIDRFKKYYELSLQLVSLCGSDWKHDERVWIINVVAYSNAPSLTAYKSALFNADPLHGTLDIKYKPTFIAQCDELVNMSQEASIGKLLASQRTRTARKDNKKDKAKKKEPSDQTAMSTKVSVEPVAPSDPVKHFIDATKIAPNVLKAIVRARKEEIEKLISADSTEDIKTPKRQRDKKGPKKTPGKKNAKFAHNKTKQPRKDDKDKHVHHTDFESPGSSSQSNSSRDYDDSSDSDDDDNVDTYSSHFTVSRISDVQCCQEITPGLCKGPCCMMTRPQQGKFIFSKAPTDNFSANRLGMMAIDTASSINLLSKEHAGDEPILPLRKPIRLNGVQGMKSLITHYFIHQLFGFCLLGDSTSILSYGMLTSMGYLVKKADHNVITFKHPKLKGVAPIVFHRTSDKLFVASDPTLVKGWERLTGKDRIGHFRSIVNQGQGSEEQYKVSFDEGDTYVDKGIHAVQVEALEADQVLEHIKSNLAQPALSTEVEGRLGGAKGCPSQSN